MVHGGCSSIGCFAMTDPVIDELWQLVTAAFGNGQKRFHVHVFPFRMSPENIETAAHHVALPFWQTLKIAHDAFDATHQLPEINVCGQRYDVKQAASATIVDAQNTEKCG